MLTLTKNTNGTYTLNDNGTITTGLKSVFDKRKNCGDIRLPEGNSLGRKWISESRFPEGSTEIDLENLPSRNPNPTKTSPVQPRLNWEDFVPESDREVFNTIKEKAITGMKKQQMMDQIEQYKKMIVDLENNLGL